MLTHAVQILASIIAASARGGIDGTIPITATDEGLKRGEAVLLGLGIFLTICLIIFFVVIVRMAMRENAAESGDQ